MEARREPVVGENRIGPIQLFTLAFGVAIGVGWITVVGIWLGAAGPAGSGLAFAIAGTALITIGLCYARVATQFRSWGGEFLYARSAFGAAFGFWVGWFLVLAYTVVIAFEMVSLAWIVREMWAVFSPVDTISGRAVDLLIGAVALALVVTANAIGTSVASRAQDLLVLIKILMSVGLIIAAFSVADPNNLPPLWGATQSPARGLLTVLAMAPFFYAGFGVLAQAMGDSSSERNARLLPLVTVTVILATMAFYMLIIWAVAAIAPRSLTLGSSLPAAGAFNHGFHSSLAGEAVLALGLIGLLTVLNGLYFAAVRLCSAIGYNAKANDTESKERRLPLKSAAYVAASAIVLAGFGRGLLEPLLNVASLSISAVMTVVCLVLLKQRGGLRASVRTSALPIMGALVGTLLVLVPLYQGYAEQGLLSPEWIIILVWGIAGSFYLHVTRRQAATFSREAA